MKSRSLARQDPCVMRSIRMRKILDSRQKYAREGVGEIRLHLPPKQGSSDERIVSIPLNRQAVAK